jgi:hypothetical protein
MLKVDETLSLKPVGEVSSLFISSLTLLFEWGRPIFLRTCQKNSIISCCFGGIIWTSFSILPHCLT